LERIGQSEECWLKVGACVLGMMQIVNMMRRNDGGRRFYFEVLFEALSPERQVKAVEE
jgi:hypothetical protein